MAETSTAPPPQAQETRALPIARHNAPVFVLGCGRSGTKMLYHTLLSAGGFAVYHAESNAFNLLGLRFGNLRHRENRQKMLDVWFTSKLFERSGLKPEEIEHRVLTECRNAGDFLRILMETIARKQQVHRWAECTPLHLLYLPLIKKLIPEALIIHIIRDGRDVAVSLNRIGWIRPFAWDRKRGVIAAGLFWQWIVNRGLEYGRIMGNDYMEIRYEDLVANPRNTLRQLGEFIVHDLDYDRIQRVGLGSLQNPNSSFKSDAEAAGLSPVGRWRNLLSREQLRDLESAIGELLSRLEYPLATPSQELHSRMPIKLMRGLYPAVFATKLWLKTYTPLARTADIGRMGFGGR